MNLRIKNERVITALSWVVGIGSQIRAIGTDVSMAFWWTAEGFVALCERYSALLICLGLFLGSIDAFALAFWAEPHNHALAVNLFLAGFGLLFMSLVLPPFNRLVWSGPDHLWRD